MYLVFRLNPKTPRDDFETPDRPHPRSEYFGSSVFSRVLLRRGWGCRSSTTSSSLARLLPPLLLSQVLVYFLSWNEETAGS